MGLKLMIRKCENDYYRAMRPTECKHSEWRIINDRDDKDFVCLHDKQYEYYCTLSLKCPYYEPTS